MAAHSRILPVYTTAHRILASLQGLAVGDAIGKQSETLAIHAIAHWYPNGIRGFEGVPGAVIPRYASNSKHQWRIGETTDDTERTLAVARAVLADRTVSHVGIGREMLGCGKCVHPGVRSLWEFHQAGDPARVATTHDGCGAAVRVAPVGFLYKPHRVPEIVAGAREASISTHGGSRAIAAAAAVAAAVSSAIDGAGPGQVLDGALRAAVEAERQWPPPSPPSFADAIQCAHDTIAEFDQPRPAAIASCYFPDQPLTIVPLALALATTLPSARLATLVAANVGGDSDSVASMAGAILGAMHPDTVDPHWFAVVAQVNGHDMADIAHAVAALRH
jgi:ADP-ribosylglycohydrolase